jgi:ABC-2 type transport system permease protein
MGDRKTGRLAPHLSLLRAYFGANAAMEMEYRASFFARILSMLVNDCMWLTFWVFYFNRFPVVQGWGKLDIIRLWAVIAAGFGLADVLFGNTSRLARIIYQGDLDVYLSQPKNVLFHALIARSSVTGWGDVAFGVLVFALIGESTPLLWLLFVYTAMLIGVLFLSFNLIGQSLTFYIGNSEMLAVQMNNALIHFATYPTAIFDTWTRVLFFTVIPAGLISYTPIGILRGSPMPYLAYASLAAIAFMLISTGLFFSGLRRYESGNLITTRL